MCLQVNELLTLRGKLPFQLEDSFLRLSTQGSQPDDPGCPLRHLGLNPRSAAETVFLPAVAGRHISRPGAGPLSCATDDKMDDS